MSKAKTKKICKNLPKEITEYPKTDAILYTDGRRSYHYIIKQEGLYLQPPVLAYTQGKNKYKIPDSYCVETTWGRGKNKKTVRCFIDYIEEKPLFKIMYGMNFSEEIQSNISSTTAANIVLKKLFPLNEKSLISGVHLFGIHLKTLKQAREKMRENYSQLKPLEVCGKSTVYKRQRKFGNQLKEQAQIEGAKIYGENQVVLKQISFNVKCMDFQIDYGQKDQEKKLISLVRAIDQNHISREGYRALAALHSNLEREWAISEMRHKITREINQKISITLVDIPIQNQFNFIKISYDFDSEIIQKIIKNGKGGCRSAKDILTYIIPVLVLDGILDTNNPVIHLRVSGDGRNVGRKIKHVMLTITILNDEQNIYIPDRHYTTVLFSGTENYEILEIAMASFIQELNELKNYGLIINEVHWIFELYFSADWKFLAICLGFNVPNSNYFCPWCQVSKNNQVNHANQINHWKIDKKMEKINESISTYPGHIKRPLFYMIPLEKWVPDELHVMLRIWDRLWSLFIAELKESNQFDDLCRDEIVQEMNQVGVKFQFWKERGTNTWNYTSSMGDDKLKILRNFNLYRILPPSRARKIRELWDRFNQIYINLKLKDYDPQKFQFEAEDWLELFLTPDRVIPNSTQIEKGLYKPSEITPYMHVLVHHMSEFIEKHKQFGIKLFSCAPVEKKNHQQVTHFFRQTLKDGGKDRKSAIIDILEYENRVLFYLFDNVETPTPKPKKIYISREEE